MFFPFYSKVLSIHVSKVWRVSRYGSRWRPDDDLLFGGKLVLDGNEVACHVHTEPLEVLQVLLPHVVLSGLHLQLCLQLSGGKGGGVGGRKRGG